MLSNITFAELEENYYTQAKYLVEGGVDVLLVETAQDILEVKAAIAGFERLFAELGRRVAIQAQVTLDTSGRMLLGTDIASAMTTLEALPIDVIGLNCSTGPEHMREPIRFLATNATRPVSCIPNAGLPLNTGTGDAVYPLEPEPMAEMLGEFVEQFGVRIVGGCCGTRRSISRRLWQARRRTARSGDEGSGNGVGDAFAVPRIPHPGMPRPRAHSRLQSPARLVGHARDGLRSESEAAAHRRARERAGLAQGEAAAARRRLRGRSRTSRASRSSRARTCSTSASRSPSAATKRSRWRRSSSCSR